MVDKHQRMILLWLIKFPESSLVSNCQSFTIQTHYPNAPCKSFVGLRHEWRFLECHWRALTRGTSTPLTVISKRHVWNSNSFFFSLVEEHGSPFPPINQYFKINSVHYHMKRETVVRICKHITFWVSNMVLLSSQKKTF